ncbi:hypothetical protein IJU97_03805 [bacterium]|nr:hypothetical protein [bacterium]
MVKNRNHRRNSFNVHHVIGRSNEKRAKVEEETNKMLIEVFKHDAINTLFQENQSPHEQLAVMVEIRRPVLSF